MNLSTKIDNKGKDILSLGKGPTQGLGKHSLSAEKMYSIYFTKENTEFFLSLHCNGPNSYLFVNGTEIHKFGANSYLFVNGTEIHKFTSKDSEITPYNLCLGNVSKDFSASNMEKNWI